MERAKLKVLVSRFAEIDQLPIEIDEIRQMIIGLGDQDDIKFSAEDIDPNQLYGSIYQYTRSPAVYAEPLFCTLIVYSEHLTSDWQRLVCAKELVHIFDPSAEQVTTSEGLADLVDRLTGLASSNEFGLSDIIEAKDRIAIYQCLPVLFPAAAREQALRALEEGRYSLLDISKQACMPAVFVEVVLSSKWPEIEKLLLDL